MDRNDTSFLAQKAKRSDYGCQFEILVAILYNHLIASGDTVIDGGANTGLHAYPLAQQVGRDGLLVAFEPVPNAFARLKQDVAPFRTELHQAALGDHEGEVPFVVDERSTALSHIQTPFEILKPYHTLIKARSTTLDEVLGERNVTFIKLDLEGADFLAIRGGRSLIQRARPIIIFENSREWAAKCNGYTKQDFFDLFNAIGYVIHDLHGRALTAATWDDENMTFEYIALPREAGNLIRQQLAIIEFFWKCAAERPLMPIWIDCVLAIREVAEYMTGCHGPDWYSRALAARAP